MAVDRSTAFPVRQRRVSHHELWNIQLGCLFFSGGRAGDGVVVHAGDHGRGRGRPIGPAVPHADDRRAARHRLLALTVPGSLVAVSIGLLGINNLGHGLVARPKTCCLQTTWPAGTVSIPSRPSSPAPSGRRSAAPPPRSSGWRWCLAPMRSRSGFQRWPSDSWGELQPCAHTPPPARQRHELTTGWASACVIPGLVPLPPLVGVANSSHLLHVSAVSYELFRVSWAVGLAAGRLRRAVSALAHPGVDNLSVWSPGDLCRGGRSAAVAHARGRPPISGSRGPRHRQRPHACHDATPNPSTGERTRVGPHHDRGWRGDWAGRPGCRSLSSDPPALMGVGARLPDQPRGGSENDALDPTDTERPGADAARGSV